MRDLIGISDLEPSAIRRLVDDGLWFKKTRGQHPRFCDGLSAVMLFTKPSNRTRLSFEVGCNELGIHSSFVQQGEIKIGERESLSDIARVLSRYMHAIIFRVFSHEDILTMREYATCPVINALSDRGHPCQALADVMTMIEHGLDLTTASQKKVTYIGDMNNVFRSLAYACALLDIPVTAVIPDAYVGDEQFWNALEKDCPGHQVTHTTKPSEGVEGASFVYTDVWASMGMQMDGKRRKYFRGYQVNSSLLQGSLPDAKVMHCLPANRGQEITDDVMDGEHGIVFDQAENRLHMHKAILAYCLGKDTIREEKK